MVVVCQDKDDFVIYACRWEQKIKRLDADLAKQRDKLRALSGKPGAAQARRKAMEILQRRKFYEAQLEKIYSNQYQIDNVTFTTSAMQSQAEMIKAMQTASKEMQRLRKQHKELDPDHVHEVMDALEDEREFFEDIELAMSSYEVPNDVTEEELMAEMDLLEDDIGEEVLHEETPVYLQNIDIPEAPQSSDFIRQGVPANPGERNQVIPDY